MKNMLSLSAVALALFAASPSTAESRHDIYNGATCIPSPPFDASTPAPSTFSLVGFRGSARCHFTIPDGWRAEDVFAVVFNGRANPGAGPMRMRRCLYGAVRVISTSCSAEGTIAATGDLSSRFVKPPPNMPDSPVGGYLLVRFPTDRRSELTHFIPIFSR